MLRRLGWLALPVALVLALVAGRGDDTGPRTREERVESIASGIRCPTCQGLSVADSRAGTAKAIREEIDRRVGLGESDEEVRAYLVSRYGRAALLRPEGQGVAALVWVLPVAVVLGAALFMAGLFLVRHRRLPRRWTLVAGAAGTVAVAVIAGVAVARTAGERLPGEPATGSIGLPAAPAPSSGLAEARRLMSAGNAAEALKAFDRVLAEDADNPEALAYRGWVLRLAGLSDEGLAYIDKAIAADPAYPDAHFFRGIVLLQDKNDATGAIPELRQYLASDPPPEMVPAVERVLRQALGETSQ